MGDEGLGEEGVGSLGASPSEALSIPPLMGWRMCLGVSMTTLLHARDIPRQHGQVELVSVCVCVCVCVCVDPLRPTYLGDINIHSARQGSGCSLNQFAVRQAYVTDTFISAFGSEAQHEYAHCIHTVL